MKKNFPLISLLILFFLFVDFLSKKKNELKEYQARILPEILFFESNINLNQANFEEFRKINCKNILLEDIKYNKSFDPDVSVIMTMYNQAHCIHKGLRSIQNQSIKNIEIIIIDDCSEDNSTDVIKEYQKEDQRIILISHDTNEGEMKSRVDGIREAKGKYITIVDGDDALIHRDILKNCLFIAKKAKLDAVEFQGLLYKDGKPIELIYDYHGKNISNIIYQPELRFKFIDVTFNNRAIWGKLIKNELFQKILTFLGPEFTDDYINEAEDTFMSISLFNLAQSYYIMNEIGYYYSKDEKNNSFPKIRSKTCKINLKIKNFGWYKYYKFLIDKKSKHKKEKKLIINEMKITDPRKKLNVTLDKRHYKILYYIYDRMLSWYCWSKNERNYIIEEKNKALTRKI